MTQKEREGSQLQLELKEQLTAMRAELTESRSQNESLRETLDQVCMPSKSFIWLLSSDGLIYVLFCG